jgi:protein O-GlcNAc transferase
MNIDESIKAALEHLRSGNLQRAEEIFLAILKERPHDSQLLYFLGVAYYQLQKYDLSIEYIRKSLAGRPDAEAYNVLGNAYRRAAQDDAALLCYQKALQINPNLVESYNNLGILLLGRKQLDAAISCFQKALQINPDSSDVYFNLGNCFQEKGAFDEAITYYHKALSYNPYDAEAYDNLGVIFQEKEQFDKAMAYYQKAIEINPDTAETYNNIGIILKKMGEIEESLHCFNKAIEMNRDYTDAYINLGVLLQEEGRHREAIAAYDMILARNPKLIKVLWGRCFAQLPVIHHDYSDIEIARKQYSADLIKLNEAISLKTIQDISDADEAVGSQQPFYLAYQGFNDRDLQRFYGAMVCRIMASRYPQFSQRPVLKPPSSGETIRVGVVSGYFHDSSMWKIPIKGWIENLDKRRFSLYGYYTGRKKDRETEGARKHFTRFVEDVYSFETLCQTILTDNLHIIMFTEIGQDRETLRLAGLRLAPVQCCSALGHPETSGLPTIDYSISSDRMEPPDADDHYTEKLVRLPNLSFYYTPLDIPVIDTERDIYGLRSSSVLYLCCQSLYKYLPQYDELYPRIAQRVGDCQFLFISHEHVPVTEQFRERLRDIFKKYKVNDSDHVIFLPRLSAPEFNAINNLADVFLDSIGWSGCNSTFEAIACNLPVVTLPGVLMRGRHSAAILNIMGVKETVASTMDEYIELAVRLGNDAEWRQQISEKIAENKHRIYKDWACIAALEEFLEKAVREPL